MAKLLLFIGLRNFLGLSIRIASLFILKPISEFILFFLFLHQPISIAISSSSSQPNSELTSSFCRYSFQVKWVMRVGSTSGAGWVRLTHFKKMAIETRSRHDTTHLPALNPTVGLQRDGRVCRPIGQLETLGLSNLAIKKRSIRNWEMYLNVTAFKSSH